MTVYMTTQDVLELKWQKNPRPLRDRSGVYRIVERITGKLLYIGQASNLGTRLAPSVHPVFDREKHDVFILFEKEHDERRRMEGVFIQILKPKLNKRNGTMPEPSEEQLREYYNRIFGQNSWSA